MLRLRKFVREARETAPIIGGIALMLAALAFGGYVALLKLWALQSLANGCGP